MKIIKNNWLIVLFLALILVEVGVFLRGPKSSDIGFQATDMSITNYANSVIKKCAEEKYRPTCYDKEIPKLLEKITMEDAFRVTKAVQLHEGDQYEYCHVLGHNLSAKETAKDPSKWKDVVTRCPSGMCSNGCIHGAFQERFRTETMTDAEIDALVPEFKTVCEPRGTWDPTGMEKATCYHAVGHLIMFISGGNINKSNEICEKLDQTFFPVCFDGNFMKIFQPLASEDFDLVKNIAPKTKEAAIVFCSQFTGIKYNSCHQESWPLSVDEIRTPAGLVKFCSYREDKQVKDRCYNAMFYVVSAQLGLEIPKIKDFCSQLPNSKKGLCFSNSASRMIETDYNLGGRAVDLCKVAEGYGVGEQCYEELITYSTFNYHAGSIGQKYLCDAMPEPWQSKCKK